jgi:hypothetical protein
MEVKAGLRRGKSSPKPIPEFEDVCATVERVASCGIRGEQVAEVGLGRGGVCPRAKFYFG